MPKMLSIFGMQYVWEHGSFHETERYLKLWLDNDILSRSMSKWLVSIESIAWVP